MRSKIIYLDYEKTYSYFINHIECGKTLSLKIVQRIDFKKGHFFTLLPKNADLSKLYLFSYGGIIPSIPHKEGKELIAEEHSEYYPRQVITTKNELSIYIYDYLKTNALNFGIVESYSEDLNDPHVGIEKVRMIPYGNEVYYLLSEETSIKDISLTISMCSEAWHSLIILTQLKNFKSLYFSPTQLDLICDNVQRIIVSAYDEESYIVWEKNK